MLKWGYSLTDEAKTKDQLIEENRQLRRQINELSQKDKLYGILANLVEGLPNGIVVTDLESRIIYVNKAIEQLTGYQRQEVIGRYPGLLNCEVYAEEIQQQIICSMQSNKNWCGLISQERIDGSRYKAEVEIFPVQTENGTVAWASIHRDIEAEDRYKKLVELSPDAIAVYSEGKIVYINNVGAQIYGAKNPQELIGMPIGGFIHPEFRQLLSERVQKMLASGEPAFLAEGKSIKLDGTVVEVEVAAAPISFHGGQAILVVVRDITERNQILKELKRAKQDKEIILNAISELVVYHDSNMIIRWVNQTAGISVGMLPEQLVGHRCFEIWQKRKDPCPGCMVQKSISTGQYEEGEIADPTGVIWLVKAYPVKDGQNTVGVVEVARNITKQKQMEMEMARLERLNLIGQMAAGLGHEVRNPMTTVRGFLQLLKNKEGLSNYKDYFELMLEELDRANNIITQYLSLVKKKTTKKLKQNINTILRALYPLIQADAFKSDIHFTLELKSIPDLIIDEEEIHQLVLNLVRNGLEAMSTGGNLTIRTYVEEDEVVLAIQDQGAGIKSDLLKKIGTPFFTTKDNGTGLGLAICNSIAARHNARIEMESGCSGTTVIVRFNQTIA